MKFLTESVAELFARQYCLICGVPPTDLCEGCFISQVHQPLDRCYICNKLRSDGRPCPACRSQLRRIHQLGLYHKQLKELIWQMKFFRARRIARLLGELLAEEVGYYPADTVVVSVPTAALRTRRRGFDQARLMAQSFAQQRGLRYQNMLLRTTKVDLIGKRRIERLRLISASMRLRSRARPSGTILLVDDVLTTGATLEAAAQLLRSAGAAHVDGLVAARRLRS